VQGIGVRSFEVPALEELLQERWSENKIGLKRLRSFLIFLRWVLLMPEDDLSERSAQ
jgi:hypothetical protein